MRVVFMGTPIFAVPTLKALCESEFPVVGIVTQPDRPKGRGNTVSPSPIKELGQAQEIPILQPEKMKHAEFLHSLEQWKPDTIVVAAFGRILPKVILDLPPRGCINVHASLLPRYRGAAPMQWAIIKGDAETGITTMLMDEGMDTGAILLQETVPIHPEETAGELSPRLASVGGELLLNTLRGWQSNQITPRSQDEHDATMAPLLKREDGIIPWDHSAVQIVNRIRGMSPWPGAYTFWEEERIIIWKAAAMVENEFAGTESPGTILKVGKNELVVSTGQGVLGIVELQPANRKRLSITQFLAGHALRPGMKFGLSSI